MMNDHRLGKHKFCRWVSRHASWILYIWVTFIMVGGGWLFDYSQKLNNYNLCRGTVAARTLLLDLVFQSTNPSALDLTALPAYKELDPATQLYFQQLNAGLRASAGSNSEFRQYAERVLVIPKCKRPGIL